VREQTQEAVLRGDAQAFLGKPVELAQLVGAIARLLEVSGFTCVPAPCESV